MKSDTPSMHPFETDLLPMLARTARETATPRDTAVPVSHRTRWRRAVLVLAAGLCLALVVPLLSDDPLRGALAIEQHGDMVHVSVKDASADPEAMTNDLRALGLPAHVEVVAVSKSLEGSWVDFVNDNAAAGFNDPRIVDLFRQLEDRPAVLKIPIDFSTPFILVVGRPAEAGETYHIAASTDVEGAYQCLGLAGMTPDEAQEAIAAKGYEALWYYEHSDMPYTEALEEVPSDKVIVGAEFIGPTTVIVNTADPRSEATQDSASKGGGREASC